MLKQAQLKSLLSWLRQIFTPLALVFLIYIAWHSQESLSFIFSKAQLGYLLLAVLFVMLYHCTVPVATAYILKAAGIQLPYALLGHIYIKRLITRYIPGGIWHMVSRASDLHQQGLTKTQLGIMMLLESFFGASLSLSMGGVGILYIKGLDFFLSPWIVLILIANALALWLMPYVLKRFILKNESNFEQRYYWQAVAVYIPIFLLISLAFVCYLSAFAFSDNIGDLIEYGSIFLFSIGVGLVTPFAPQGLGVFEWVSGSLLNLPIAIGSAIVLIAGFRAVLFLADVSLWLLQRLLTKP